MKTFKLLLTMVLCLALIFTCATSFTSCKPKNDAETNEDSSSNNTSDENSGNVDSGNQDSGNTDSGNTDSGNNDSGNGNTSTHTHSYDTSAITKYPGVNAKGEKTFYCSCGDSYTEEIEAVTVVLPSFANVLAEMIGEHTYGLEISSGSEIVLVKEARESGCSPDGPTYDNGFKDFLAVKVAEASVSGEGGVFKGMLKVEIGYVNVILDGTYTSDLVVHPDTFDTILTLDLYVNGDAVSVSAGLDGDLSEEEIEDISREIYSSIANSVGLTYDQLVELYYISGQLKEYAPLVDGVVDVINSINMSGNNADLNELVALIASTIMDSEQDGNNTIYTIRAENLSELIDNIDNKTVVELIDAKYG